MFATVNREVRRIVFGVFGGHPIGIGSVAGGAIIAEIGLYVVGFCCALEVRLVTGKTVAWRAGIIACYVAFCTIRNLVAFGEREKIVLHFVRSPAGLLQIVAFLTISGEAGLFVVWIGGGVVIFQVTAGAIISDPFKRQGRSRLVALCAIDGFVHTSERKTVFLVQVGDIVYNPVVGRMATRAIRAHRLLVHIRVAGNTV